MSNKKDIKDYLHLYIGCDVKLINDISEDYGDDSYDAPEVGSIGKLKLINEGGFNIRCGEESEEWPYGVSFKDSYICFWDAKDFKPILRPLASMTDAEAQEYKQIDFVSETNNLLREIRASHLTNFFYSNKMAECTRWLLSKHFDLFVLIESGLAIDNSTK